MILSSSTDHTVKTDDIAAAGSLARTIPSKMKPGQVALPLVAALLAVVAKAEDAGNTRGRLPEEQFGGYLSITEDHSSKPVAELLAGHDASRVTRFVVSGYAQGVPSVVHTVVETAGGAWVDVSWMLADSRGAKTYRTELLEGDVAAWKSVLGGLNHRALRSVDDEVGEWTLDGRSVWLVVRNGGEEFHYGFRNPSYSKIPELQSLRLVDLLLSDWGRHSFGPAKYGYEPNPGTTRRARRGADEGDEAPAAANSRDD